MGSDVFPSIFQFDSIFIFFRPRWNIDDIWDRRQVEKIALPGATKLSAYYARVESNRISRSQETLGGHASRQRQILFEFRVHAAIRPSFLSPLISQGLTKHGVGRY